MFTKQFIIKILSFGLIIFVSLMIFFGDHRNYKLVIFFNYWLFIQLPISLFLHELFHALGFFMSDFSKKGISFGFGKQLIPYARSTKKLFKRFFLVSAILPFLILGVGSFVLTFYTSNKNIITFTIINIVGCSGDLLIINNRLKNKKYYV